MTKTFFKICYFVALCITVALVYVIDKKNKVKYDAIGKFSFVASFVFIAMGIINY